MSAFAVDFRPDRLIVAGDTLGYAPDRAEARPLGFIPKVLPLPHLRGVMFARGMQIIPVRALAYLMLSPSLFTVEAVADALPAVLQELSAEYARQIGIPDYRALGLVELIFGGWSEREGRMRIWSFASYEDYAPHADRGAEHYGMLPFPQLPPRYMPSLDGLTTDESLVAIIQAAGRLFADPTSQMGSARIGGEILATEITPTGMAQRTLYRFPDYAETMHAGAAVTRRIERGDLQVDVAAGLVPISEAVDSATGERLHLRTPPVNDQQPSRAERRRAEAMARRTQKRA